MKKCILTNISHIYNDQFLYDWNTNIIALHSLLCSIWNSKFILMSISVLLIKKVFFS